MKMNDWSILGFQLRSPANSLNAWDHNRRDHFALTQTCARPLSVDLSVWPLSENAADYRVLFDDFFGLETPPNGLRLHTLQVNSRTPSVGDSDLIGLGVEDSAADYLRNMHRIDVSDQAEIRVGASGWSLAGFDVADQWLVSAICNIGCSDDAKLLLRSRFQSELNDNCLFSRQEDAHGFAVGFSEVVPTHAPYFVFEIWRKT